MLKTMRRNPSVADVQRSPDVGLENVLFSAGLLWEFFTIIDLSALDVAISDARMRGSWLRSLGSLCHQGLDPMDADRNGYQFFYLRWVDARGIRLKTIQYFFCFSTQLPLSRLLHPQVDFLSLEEYGSAMTNEVLRAATAACPQLTRIALHDCEHLTDSGLDDLTRHCPHLEVVGIHACANVGDSAIRYLTDRCGRSLRWLSISHCERVTDAAVRFIGSHCPNLQTLKVAYCKELTDRSMNALARGCPALRTLDVSGCHHLTDSGYRSVTKACPLLSCIDITSCRGISKSSFIALAAELKTLNSVELSNWCALAEAATEIIGDHYDLDEVSVLLGLVDASRNLTRRYPREFYRALHLLPVCDLKDSCDKVVES